MKIRIALCGALMMLCGCAGTQPPPDAPPRSFTELPAARAAPPPASAAARAVAPGYLADSRLDIIRDKVPLTLRAEAVTSVQLENARRPGAQERRAIRSWQELRLAEHQRASVKHGAPSARLQATRILLTRAITQLYAGQLTYGQFARKVIDIDAQHRGEPPPSVPDQAKSEARTSSSQGKAMTQADRSGD